MLSVSKESNELKKTGPYFNSAEISGKITNQYAREYGTTIFVFTGAKVNINKRIESEIKSTKDYSK